MFFIFSLTVPSSCGHTPYPVGLTKQYFKNIKTLRRMRAQKRLGILEGKYSGMSHILWKTAMYSILPVIHAWFIWFVTWPMHLFRHAHNPTNHPEVFLVQGSVLIKHLEKRMDGFSWNFNVEFYEKLSSHIHSHWTDLMTTLYEDLHSFVHGLEQKLLNICQSRTFFK